MAQPRWRGCRHPRHRRLPAGPRRRGPPPSAAIRATHPEQRGPAAQVPGALWVSGVRGCRAACGRPGKSTACTDTAQPSPIFTESQRFVREAMQTPGKVGAVCRGLSPLQRRTVWDGLRCSASRGQSAKNCFKAAKVRRVVPASEPFARLRQAELGTEKLPSKQANIKAGTRLGLVQAESSENQGRPRACTGLPCRPAPPRRSRRRPGAARPGGVRPIPASSARNPPRDSARLVARELKDVRDSGVEYPPARGKRDTQATCRQQVGPPNRGVGGQGPASML